MPSKDLVAITVYLPKEERDAAMDAAKRKAMNLSQFCARAIKFKVAETIRRNPVMERETE